MNILQMGFLCIIAWTAYDILQPGSLRGRISSQEITEMTKTQKEIVDKQVELIALLLNAAQLEPNRARAYTKARAKIEQSMKLTGDGMHRQLPRLERPESVGLPVHEKRTEQEPKRIEQQGDILADNLPETDEKPKRRRNAKNGDTPKFDDVL
jgi:hypothetical protein